MFLSLPSPSSVFLQCLLFFLLRSPPVTLCQLCGNATASSTYKSNLNRLPSLFSNGSLSGGFSNFVLGQEPDKLYGLALCRGDTNDSPCLSCLDTASHDIVQICPDKIEAVIWYDRCLLRYSNQSDLATTKESEDITLWNAENITDRPLFNMQVFELLLGYMVEDAAEKKIKKFSTGQLYDPTKNFPTIYGLVQCTPDQSEKLCRNCLQEILDRVLPDLPEKKGGRVLRVYCNFRYEIYKFYDGESLLMLPSSTPAPAPLVPPLLVNPPAPLVPPPVNPGKGAKITSC